MATKEKTIEKDAIKSVAKSTSKTTTAKAEAKAKKTITHEQIRHKAYEIYLKTGSINEHDNWVKAEKELLN